jgi:multidrug efflux system outer membrane protein
MAGCSLVPEYKRSPGEVPQEYRFQSSDGETTPELGSIAALRWWELFDDPQLQYLIHTALAQNYDVRLAAERVVQARALVGGSRALWLPQVDGSYIYRHERFSQAGNTSGASSVDPTIDTHQLSLDLFWEIDFFGRLRSQTEAAKAEFFASEWARQAVISTVVADVAQAYFELRALDLQLEIAKRTLDSYHDSLRLVELRFERGTASKQDIYQVSALVHTAGATIPDLERSIAQKENQISILLGMNPYPIVRGLPLDQLTVRASLPAGLPSSLLERRPDIRQAEDLLIANNYLVGAARAEFFPRISLTGLLGTQSTSLSDLFTGPARIWSIGPTVTQPIFRGGSLYYNLQSTKSQKEQSMILYQQTVRQAFREVSDGLIAHAKLREFLKEQEALVGSYRDYTHLANVRYKGGLESYLAVLDAERELFTAELDLVTVLRDQLITFVQLYKALGGGWEADAPFPDAPATLPGLVNISDIP